MYRKFMRQISGQVISVRFISNFPWATIKAQYFTLKQTVLMYILTHSFLMPLWYPWPYGRVPFFSVMSLFRIHIIFSSLKPFSASSAISVWLFFFSSTCWYFLSFLSRSCLIHNNHEPHFLITSNSPNPFLSFWFLTSFPHFPLIYV